MIGAVCVAERLTSRESSLRHESWLYSHLSCVPSQVAELLALIEGQGAAVNELAVLRPKYAELELRLRELQAEQQQ